LSRDSADADRRGLHCRHCVREFLANVGDGRSEAFALISARRDDPQGVRLDTMRNTTDDDRADGHGNTMTRSRLIAKTANCTENEQDRGGRG
jgi:hypothetical protein